MPTEDEPSRGDTGIGDAVDAGSALDQPGDETGAHRAAGDRRAFLAGGAGLAGAGVAAAGLAYLWRDDGDAASTPPVATAPAGMPPGGWRDATRDHGAAGTGEGDDAPALQAAIDAAAAEGAGRLRGGIVHVGPGIYPLGASLQMRTGVTLQGAGPGTVLQLRSGVDAPAIVAEADPDGSPVAYVAIRSLTLDGSTGSQTNGRHGIAISSNNSGSQTPYTGSDSFPVIADVLVAYFGGHGIALGIDPEGGEANVRGARCFNVIAFECAKAATDGDRSGFLVRCTDGALVACEAAGCGGPGYDVVRANNRLEGCKGYFNQTEFRITGERNQLVGCQAQDGFGDGFVLGGPGSGLSDTSLVGCQADTNAGAGFRLTGVTASVVSGLTAFVRGDASSDGPGVVLRGTSRCLLSGAVRGFPTAVDGDNPGGVTQLVT
ncbi:MAG: glycosyl hydrolase family 28-related protein [Iamia sp.]